jgi:hypothetical protein
MAAGVLGLVAGTGVASAALTRAGAAGVLAGSLLVAGQYARVYAIATGRAASPPAEASPAAGAR